MDGNATSTGPAPGVTSTRPVDNDSRGPLVVGIAAMFLAINIIFMGVRGYVRGYLLKGWGLDDWFFMLSGLFSTAQCLMILLNASDSTLGQHVWNIPVHEIIVNIHYLVAIVLVYQASFAVIKATYLLQYRRAFAVRFMRVFCNTLLAVVFVTMCTFMISGAIVMRPLLEFGLSTTVQQSFLTWSYANASVQLVTDIVIFILPLPLVSRLQVSRFQKAGLIASFGVGMFTGGISIMRIVTLGIGIHSEDPFYESVPLILLGMAEITSANICICVPILRPLIPCLGKYRGSTQGSRKPLSKDTDKAAASGVLSPSLPSQSPTSPIRPEAAHENLHENAQWDRDKHPGSID